MNRPLKLPFLIVPVLLVAWASFACGQLLRNTAETTPAGRVRLSAMPETHLSGLGSARVGTEQEEDAAQSLLEVLRYVKSEFVDRVDDDKKLGYGAVRTMVVSLDDPKTRFFDPAQKKQLLERLNGEYHGICATLAVIKQTRNGIDQRRVAVVAPAPGGPADKAGIRPGDVITELDGRWIIAYDTRQDLDHLRTTTQDERELKKAYDDAAARMNAGLSLPKALEAMNTQEGKTVVATVERAGHAAPLKVTIHTAATKVEPAEYIEISPKIGYLRVTQFNDRSAQLMDHFLADAKGRSLVVDLRDNPGGPVAGAGSGTLGGALAVLGKLAPAGPVATILRPGNKTESLEVKSGHRRDGGATGGGPATSGKLVVLVNSGTCNVAEMAAAALRDRAGAKLVGEHTFGDATWQKLFDLRDGAAMTVFAGKIQTSKGADFGGKGIQPDYGVPSGGPKSNDAAVARAIELLSLKAEG